MAINKVVYGNRTLIDLTGVTVTADKLLEGYTALDKSGTLITGTLEVPTPVYQVEPLSVMENGTYTAPTGTAYSPVTVNVQEVEPEPPTDGKTHIWIEIDENTPANRLKFTLRWKQTVSRGVRVDWGDGSDPETYAGTGVANREHTYPRGGEYEITLEVLGGELQFEGTTSSSGYAIYGSKASSNAYNRSRIFQMIIGNGVTQIGVNTFQYCHKLQSITIPNGVITIASSAFNRCSKLKSIKIPEGVTRIDQYIFYNCYSLASVEIPESVESIGDYAFFGCSNLESVIMPQSVDSIGNNAFASCNNLATITLSDGLERIGNNSFSECNHITDLIIPSTVTEIGTYAFSYSTFGRIRFEPMTPPTVNLNAFKGLPTDCVISVPVGTLAAYTSAANYPSSSTYTYIEE